MPGLIGKKIGMTSVFGADGKNIPCTVENRNDFRFRCRWKEYSMHRH